MYHKLSGPPPAGLTTEISALATYAVAGLVQREHYWIAITVGVLSVVLLELKKGLEGLTRHLESNEIITVAKFLVLSVVILPIVPDRDLTRFHLNPFQTWLVVVAVSGVSFASYVLQRPLRSRGGVMLSAILGGAYSSTVTTVVLARRARQEERPNLYAGSILTASAVMYARLVLLVRSSAGHWPSSWRRRSVRWRWPAPWPDGWSRGDPMDRRRAPASPGRPRIRSSCAPHFFSP
jgi:uncharacterized membrane protein (DUF4010 family)